MTTRPSSPTDYSPVLETIDRLAHAIRLSALRRRQQHEQDAGDWLKQSAVTDARADEQYTSQQE
jgi:hypothetical protein